MFPCGWSGSGRARALPGKGRRKAGDAGRPGPFVMVRACPSGKGGQADPRLSQRRAAGASCTSGGASFRWTEAPQYACVCFFRSCPCRDSRVPGARTSAA
ncbi:hypothetical protein DESPIG_02351 [Desulfovibrio piger ATCC 29098]|uniref:Uncharacterized protein n=1 Tax=Desulfovibrio piger ATCC 29098 TaxID=411464 RepID=B6WW83_9BACT|nr:hypothetical protein DESPIG_02351 [Desulfovibrio piger ATCC 29098]